MFFVRLTGSSYQLLLERYIMMMKLLLKNTKNFDALPSLKITKYEVSIMLPSEYDEDKR